MALAQQLYIDEQHKAQEIGGSFTPNVLLEKLKTVDAVPSAWNNAYNTVLIPSYSGDITTTGIIVSAISTDICPPANFKRIQ